jgi:hypothetical protein
MAGIISSAESRKAMPQLASFSAFSGSKIAAQESISSTPRAALTFSTL